MRYLKFFQRFYFSLVPRWLRRKLRHLRCVLLCTPQALMRIVLVSVPVIGCFWGVGQRVCAQTVPPASSTNTAIVNNLRGTYTGQWNWEVTGSDSDGNDVYGWVYTTGTYTESDLTQTTNRDVSYSQYWNYASTSGTNNVIGAINSLSTSGGTVRLTTDLTMLSPLSPSSPSNNRNATNGHRGVSSYRSDWSGGNIHTLPGTATVATGQRTILLDERGVAYTISNLTKAGAGTLTLAGTTGTTYSSTTFTGSAGTLEVYTGYTSTTANVGNGGTFLGNVASGVTWNTTTVNASGNFTKSGLGTLSSTDTTVIGTSTLNDGGDWWVTNILQVGNNGTNGTLNITNGRMGANASTDTPNN